MNCNIKNSLKRQIVSEISDTLDEQRVIWELLTVVALHRRGYGQKRLEDWANDVQALYNDFTVDARRTDTPYKKGSEKMSNMDTAVIRLLMELRRDKIDYLKILGLGDIRINGESVEKVLDKMDKRT